MFLLSELYSKNSLDVRVAQILLFELPIYFSLVKLGSSSLSFPESCVQLLSIKSKCRDI